MKRSIFIIGLTLLLLVMGCASEGKAEKLYLVHMDEFGDSQELTISNEEYISRVEMLLDQAEWNEMEHSNKKTIYSFYFLNTDGSYGPNYIVWRDPDNNKAKLYSDKKKAYTTLSEKGLESLQNVIQIGEENHLKDQLGE